MSSILDALGYLGDSLAKPGRAVRGVLGGRPDEALAALPFSDSLGLTDPSRAVTGHDLLDQMGFAPGDGIGGTLAGVGADVATDPLTYFGGALARGLFRGGARGGEALADAGPESHIFDLVSPEERAASTALEEGINRAFPVPIRQPQQPAEAIQSPMLEELLASAPREEAAALRRNPLSGEMLPATHLPLKELPPFESYGNTLGMNEHGLYDPTKGVAGWHLDDGDKQGALLSQLHYWDEAAADLNTMPPDGLARLRAFAEPFDPNADPMASNWGRAIATRIADLEGLGSIGDAIPQYATIAGRMQQQQHTLNHLLGGGAENIGMMTPTRGIAGDITGGAVRPSEVPSILGLPLSPRAALRATAGAYAGKLAHLPLDEGLLRKLAANAQHSRADDVLRDELGRHAAAGSFIADEAGLLGRRGIEPNIARKALADPDIQAEIARLRRIHAPRAGAGFPLPPEDAVWDEALLGPMPPPGDPFWDIDHIPELLDLPPM